MDFKIEYLYFLLAILANVGAGLFVKFSVITKIKKQYFTLAAIVLYVLGFIFYMLVLQYFPLYLVQSINALQFIILIVLATWLFNDKINTLQWFGIGAIFSGILLVLI